MNPNRNREGRRACRKFAVLAPSPVSRVVSINGGFTLIEVMIVVAIVAIIASIAFPAYQHAIREAHRTPAKTALLDLAGREERYYSTNNVYSADLAGQLGYGQSPVALPDSSTGYYLMTVSVSADSSSFQASAVPQGPQTQDECGTFTLANTGMKSNLNLGASTSSSDCWK